MATATETLGHEVYDGHVLYGGVVGGDWDRMTSSFFAEIMHADGGDGGGADEARRMQPVIDMVHAARSDHSARADMRVAAGHQWHRNLKHAVRIALHGQYIDAPASASAAEAASPRLNANGHALLRALKRSSARRIGEWDTEITALNGAIAATPVGPRGFVEEADAAAAMRDRVFGVGDVRESAWDPHMHPLRTALYITGVRFFPLAVMAPPGTAAAGSAQTPDEFFTLALLALSAENGNLRLRFDHTAYPHVLKCRVCRKKYVIPSHSVATLFDGDAGAGGDGGIPWVKDVSTLVRRHDHHNRSE